MPPAMASLIYASSFPVGYGLLNGMRMAATVLFGKSGVRIFSIQDLSAAVIERVSSGSPRSDQAGPGV